MVLKGSRLVWRPDMGIEGFGGWGIWKASDGCEWVGIGLEGILKLF